MSLSHSLPDRDLVNFGDFTSRELKGRRYEYERLAVSLLALVD